MITWIGASLGDYVIESLLGEGSYSWVYSCLGSGNEQRAIKAAKPEDVVSQGVAATRTFPTQALLQVTGSVLSVQPDAGDLLQAQIAKLQAVRAPGLPRVLEFSLQSGLSYYVMDIVHGKTLRQLMQEGPQPIDVFISIAQILQALQQDPAFLYHGDLKPENIMVQGEHIVILDPGYFGPLKTTRGPQADVAVTTPAYYPSLQPDDAHALASILWEAATGMHPLGEYGGEGMIDPARHGPNLAQYIRGCQAAGKSRFVEGLLSLQPPSLSEPNGRVDGEMENTLLGLMQLTVTAERKLERTAARTSVGAIRDALHWFKDKGKKVLDLFGTAGGDQ